MDYSGEFDEDMTPIYVNLGNMLGAYVIEPGESPFIVLHESLKDKPDPTGNIVYNALLAFHNALPSAYQLFPLVQYYENLPQAPALAVEGPEIIIFARASRRWKYPAYFPNGYRMIGS